MSDYLDPNNEELLKDFFAEAEQQVDNLESNVLVIENDPTNHEAIDEIFRAAHTLKGGSATVEMNEIASFTHSVEDMLDEIRSDRLKVTEPVIDVLLNAIDVIKAMLEARTNGSVYSKNIDDLIDTIHSYISSKGGKAPAAKSAAPKKTTPKATLPKPADSGDAAFVRPELSESEYLELKEACQGSQSLWCVAVKFDESNPMNSVGGIQVFAALKSIGSVLKTVPDFDALYEDTFYENVYYYIATSETQEKIEDTAFLADVTLVDDAQRIDSFDGSDNSEESEAAVSASVSDEPQAAESTEEAVSAKPAAAQPAQAPASHAAQTGSILRVDSRRIDYLLNLVSETVITKAAFNQLSMQLVNSFVMFQGMEASYKEKMRQLFEMLPQYLDKIKNGTSVKDVKDEILNSYGDLANLFDAYVSEVKSATEKFRSSTQNLGRFSSELQEGVMKIRMVPISQIFSRFPRVVRDLQRDLNKKIDLKIEGEDTELDKSVIEDLLDPIMHCVRNSVDHGIESPGDRKKAGKRETGTVFLKASNEGNMIIIEISDDGAGIDVQRVRQKAVQKGLIHPDKILTDQEAFNLIFEPGFSTSDKITNVSGRGVGLDVVKTMIEKLNGTVFVTSVKGRGTTFTIKLPLTLAIIQGLLVRVGSEVYSIPIASVIESQRIKLSEINTIDNYEVLNVRNEVISILRFSRLFNIREAEIDDDGYCFIVIVGSQEKKIGIMVDGLIGEEDVVIKPLRDQFTNSPGIAGASILGDGSVSLIIDVSQLLELGVRKEINAQQAIGAKR
ncbi:P2 response regulator binding domain protein [Treponema socranskii subsp. socranskii VPI DR56BR1116 = ATCC 35536]|uniref:Chemotaxis protein CheA n=1 Tax=Treponema socranskii subsp. socranskii VPI DR56BR1116 = ATCC 35536 TaxID=1125725 RepID=U1F8K5_TRESO|nr:chemotaxis protein CheA [Treponema socranskii]ERF60382.1 P2 response regulator binding domain protein [Treponema socranskii subsp. socranskii VPI DR56BR1116 = ATCC 35536]ERJ99422.1 P2 response regulator binding domain protein [Treponema socranskii subsp. socranskii VPI DR56BR1116 = ATCC 35536]